MAFTGIHVVCAFLGSNSPASTTDALLGRPIWSEKMTSAGTGNKVVPPAEFKGDAVLHIRAAADAYVAIGPTPDAVSGPASIIVPAGEFVSLYAKAGDKFAWTPVP